MRSHIVNRKIFSCVGTVLAIAAASSAFASLEDYPFRLIIKSGGDGEQVIAENKGPSPVSVCMKLAGKNFSSVPMRPAVIVVPPNTSLPLGYLDAWAADYSYYVGRTDTAPQPDARYRLPFLDDLAFPITQAYGGDLTSHDNVQNRYAVDFSMPEGTPIVAARAGMVVDVTLRHHSRGRAQSFWRKANAVTIVHDDGTIAQYAHLAPGTPLVHRGQRVEAGSLIAYSGNTGYSSGPHLHFVVSRLAVVDGKVRPVSIPFLFYADDPPVVFSPAPGVARTAVYPKPSPKLPDAVPVSHGAHNDRSSAPSSSPDPI